MYYLGQVVKVDFTNAKNHDTAFGVLLGKSFETAKGHKEDKLWYSVAVLDKAVKGTPKVYLFAEDDLGYAYDPKGKVYFGKTKTSTISVLSEDELELKESHKNELVRVNNPKMIEMNDI